MPEARAKLRIGTQEVAETNTDVFGDFKFDGLEPSGGNCHIEISHPQFGAVGTTAARGEQSMYLGSFCLGVQG